MARRITAGRVFKLAFSKACSTLEINALEINGSFHRGLQCWLSSVKGLLVIAENHGAYFGTVNTLLNFGGLRLSFLT